MNGRQLPIFGWNEPNVGASQAWRGGDALPVSDQM
jgi:hypothetical protein